MKRLRPVFVLIVICYLLFVNVNAIDVIDQPGPRPTGVNPIVKTIVNP